MKYSGKVYNAINRLTGEDGEYTEVSIKHVANELDMDYNLIRYEVLELAALGHVCWRSSPGRGGGYTWVEAEVEAAVEDGAGEPVRVTPPPSTPPAALTWDIIGDIPAPPRFPAGVVNRPLPAGGDDTAWDLLGQLRPLVRSLSIDDDTVLIEL